jgi:hypothetical protein
MKSIRLYLTVYMCVIALLTALSAVLFRIVIPELYPIFFLVIPIYFILLGLVSVVVSKNFLISNSPRMHRNWLTFKYIKIILSIILLSVYAMTVHKTIFSFMLTFFVFYFVLMIVETIYMLKLVRGKRNR